MQNKVKELFRKYGKTAVAVHFSVYFTTFGACYAAAKSKLDVEGMLVKVGLLREHAPVADGDEDDRHGWLARTLTGQGSSAALAFLCTKALMPVRAGITLTATPAVHRFVTRLRGDQLQQAAAEAQRRQQQQQQPPPR